MDTKSILAEVRENSAKIKGCQRHYFPAKGSNYRLGEKVTCANCGGLMSLTDIGSYLRGYIAAGGSSADVMPDWSETP